MSEIERIFYDVRDRFHDAEETESAMNNALMFFQDRGIDGFEAEEQINEVASGSEKDGFIKGFRYAVSLLISGKEVGV